LGCGDEIASPRQRLLLQVAVAKKTTFPESDAQFAAKNRGRLPRALNRAHGFPSPRPPIPNSSASLVAGVYQILS